MSNLAFPAWMLLTGDIVPMQGRGRFFGSRNFVMVIASVVVTYLMGEFITRVGSPQGYQLALGLSFLTGLVSTYFFLANPRFSRGAARSKRDETLFNGSLAGFSLLPPFFQFCIAMAVWNLSLNVAGPFFVYMAQDLGFTAAMIGLVAIAANITRLLTQRKVGELSDRWGSGQVQMIGMFLIPILPILWIFASQLWHVFELASFNFLLVFMPEN